MRDYSKNKQYLYAIFGAIMLIVAALFAFISDPVAGTTIGASIAILPIWGVVKDNTFRELSVEEIEKLEVTDQVKYFNDLNAFRAKKLEELREDLKKSNSDEIKNAIKELKDEISKDARSQMETMQKALEIQGEALKQLMNEGKLSAKEQTIAEIVKSNIEGLEKVMKGETKKITLKVTRSSVTDSTIAMRLTDIGQLATRALKLRGLFNQSRVGAGMNGVVRYIDQQAVTRNAAAKSEGSAAPTSVITWIEKTLALQEIKDSIPVSRRALNDVSFVESEIRNFLMKNMDLKVDADLWSADGNAPNIKGIYTYATAYSKQSTSGITDASIYDLIVDAQSQVESTTGYIANYCLMNPADYNEMLAKKDANNNYIRPPFVLEQNGNVYVNGVLIIKTSVVTAGTMLLGDFTYSTLYQGDDLTIEIGEVSTQFTEGMVTMLATEQLGLLVRSAHTDAFVKIADISAALTALLP